MRVFVLRIADTFTSSCDVFTIAPSGCNVRLGVNWTTTTTPRVILLPTSFPVSLSLSFFSIHHSDRRISTKLEESGEKYAGDTVLSGRVPPGVWSMHLRINHPDVWLRERLRERVNARAVSPLWRAMCERTDCHEIKAEFNRARIYVAKIRQRRNTPLLTCVKTLEDFTLHCRVHHTIRMIHKKCQFAFQQLFQWGIVVNFFQIVKIPANFYCAINT